MRYLFNIENLVLPRVAGSSKGQSKIPPGGGQSSMALPVKIVSCFGHLVLEFEICLKFGAWNLIFCNAPR